MKKISLIFIAAILGVAGSALAFHDGGVGNCAGCHTMHNSLNNAIMDQQLTTQFTTGPFLLQGNDQSSACLNCHGGDSRSEYRVLTTGAGQAQIASTSPPLQRTPGGDFAWMQVGADDDKQSLRGHSIKAADFGLDADSRPDMATAPGGDYGNAEFYCSSCHDPHGKARIVESAGTLSFVRNGVPTSQSGSYGDVPTATEAVGVYRLLGGAGYEPKSVAGSGVAFVNEPPIAVAPENYNIAAGEVRVAYGSGMAEWCANCHGQLHNDDYPSTHRHPSGNNADLPAGIIANYNAYVKSGDMTGDVATAYNTLVPLEKGKALADLADLAALAGDPGSTVGAEAGDNVMCLSCHRAHASGFDSMLRFPADNTFMVAGGAYTVSGGLDSTQIAAAYYDRPVTEFASYQRAMCNKCHAKD